MEFNYYYGTEADQFSFIRIPKLMLTDPMFSSLSLPAKVLYGLLLDRMGLSVKNRWLDDNNRVFIIYQIAEIQEDMGYSKKKAMEFLTELETIGLVEKRKRGFGLPSILYVKNFIPQNMVTTRGVDLGTSGSAENEVKNVENSFADGMACVIEAEINKNRQIATNNECKNIDEIPRGTEMVTTRGVDLGTSGSAHMVTSRGDGTDTTVVPIREPLNNNTKYNNTNISNIDSHLIQSREDEIEMWREYQKMVRKNLEIELMYERYPNQRDLIDSICDLIIETLASQNTSIVISSDRYPAELVKSKLCRLNSMHLEYVLDCLASNTTKVRNIKKYMLATLFNAPSTIDGFYQAEVNHDLPQYARM